MNFIFYEYIKYWYKAKGLHGIHSPYVTDFIKNVLQKKIDAINSKSIHDYQDILKKNHNEIVIEDFGKGSKKLDNRREISQMYHIISTPKKYGKLLFNLTNYCKPSNVLELGSAIGVGTQYLSAGYPEAKIYSIEGCKNTHAFTKSVFPEPNNVEFINSSFSDFFQTQLEKIPILDLIFIDGNHNAKSLLHYTTLLLEKMHDESILIIDDIRWSKDMLQGWHQLSAMECFHVSIDLFKMGILVKRNVQQKEHFTLNF